MSLFSLIFCMNFLNIFSSKMIESINHQVKNNLSLEMIKLDNKLLQIRRCYE